MQRRRLVIIDGYSLLFRAFYGTRFLSTSDGRPTNALFGFVNMLLQIFGDERYRPDAIVVALDAPGKTFRHADFAEYKGTRRETPDELISQLDFSRELLADLNIPSFEIVGYEADDIAGTLSRLGEENGYDTIVVTGDHDSLQLIDDCVKVLMPQNGPVEPKLYDADAVRERYGFDPLKIIDYKALAGDSSDNIPGVPGIGDKSAKVLIDKFGSVEEIQSRLSEVEEKFRKKIEPAVDAMILSKKLATIDRHVPVDYDFSPYHITPELLEKAKQALLSLEFKSQVNRIERALSRYMDRDGDDQPDLDAVVVLSESVEVETLADENDLAKLAAWVGNRPFSLVRPDGPAQKELFDEGAESSWVVGVGNQARKATHKAVLALFENATSQAVGHDIKSLYKEIPAKLDPVRMDTLLAAYVLQSSRNHYELDSLISGYLEMNAGSPAQKAHALHMLDETFTERLEKEKQTKVLKEVELLLVPVLAEMEGKGIAVSQEMLREFSKSLAVEIEQVQRRTYELAGEEFNIGSPKQIGEILFEKMALPGGKKTKTGWATGVEILGEMAPTVPLAAEILTYRELTKLKSTYADSLPKMIAGDGRIHTSFNQAVAATGRLSSNDPNLQNIPVRTELGRQIRRAFYAAPGYELLSLDYSQIELRVLAHMCQDENLVTAFRERVDVHTVTAALMFGIENEVVTKEQRRLAKMLNYAVLYGVTGFGLANQLGAGFSASEANNLIKQYNERFPAVKAFTDTIIDEARAKGFTATMIGRRRYFPDIHAANRQLRTYAERQAMNAPIQGTAADMIKLAMLDVRHKLDLGDTRMLLQVHDELVFEVPTGDRSMVEPIRKAMESALLLGEVPVEVDAKVGANWLEMTPITA